MVKSSSLVTNIVYLQPILFAPLRDVIMNAVPVSDDKSTDSEKEEIVSYMHDKANNTVFDKATAEKQLQKAMAEVEYFGKQISMTTL